MNEGLRGGRALLLAREAEYAAKQSGRADDGEVMKLNKLVDISKTKVWKELRQDIILMIDNAEGELHFATDEQRMWDARATSNALVTLIEYVDLADRRRDQIQEGEQDTVATG